MRWAGPKNGPAYCRTPSIDFGLLGGRALTTQNRPAFAIRLAEGVPLHKRTITIDDDLLALLLAEREKHLRLVAGVPGGATVNLGLVKLPATALMFPNPPELAGGDLTTPRDDRNLTKQFGRKAKKVLGFHFNFHSLCGTHETMLLDQGVPVHVVAARCGHDPATLLRNCAKRTKKADTSAASIIGGISRAILGN
jgi:integrase